MVHTADGLSSCQYNHYTRSIAAAMKDSKMAMAVNANEKHIEDLQPEHAKYAVHGQIGATTLFIGEILRINQRY